MDEKQGQAIVMYCEGPDESPEGVFLVATDGRNRDWDHQSWEQLAAGGTDEGMDAETFFLAYAQRFMLNNGVSRFTIVRAEVFEAEEVVTADPEWN